MAMIADRSAAVRQCGIARSACPNRIDTRSNMCSTRGVRWDGQRVGEQAQEALPGISGLVRSVRTPEFNGLVFHEVMARSVLNKVPGASSMPFGWTVNPYRGCSHGCTYCLAGDTPVLMADGRTKPIADLVV